MLRPCTLISGALCTVLLPLAACRDSSGPGPDAVDAVETARQVQNLTDLFSGNEWMQSFLFLEPLMLDTLTPGFASQLEEAGALGAAWDLSGRFDALRSSLRRAPALLSIPSELLGKTFVYNPETGRYEVDETRPAVPANVVRFILYEVPLPTSELDPLVEIGHLDIEVRNSGSTVVVTVVARGETVLEYTVSGTLDEITISGFVTNGIDRLDFAGSVTAALLEFTLSSGSLRIDIRVEDHGEGASLRVQIRDGSNRIVLELDTEYATFAVDGSVTFNGTTVAVISGTEGNPVITNSAGGDLTEEELEAVRQIFLAGAVALGVTLNLLLFGLVLLA